MLSLCHAERLWDIMQSTDSVNAAAIARILQNELRNYVKKPQAKFVDISVVNWTNDQSPEVRHTIQDMGNWIESNQYDTHLPEFSPHGNKISLIKRFRTLSQQYYPYNSATGTQGNCGLKEAKDAIEIVFKEYIR